MKPLLKDSIELARGLKNFTKNNFNVEIIVCPPFPYLRDVHEIVKGTTIGVGAQNMFWEKEGAYTGEVSPLMLKDTGCTHVILGHSERRQYMGETDAIINKKIKKALEFGLTPIVCVGENLAEREQGQAESVLAKQSGGCFGPLSREEMAKIVIAYEPVWAIGTGKTATPEQANEAHGFIRASLAAHFDRQTADEAMILYGGSVTDANIDRLMAEEELNGALVGGASLSLSSFIRIVNFEKWNKKDLSTH